MVWVGRKAQVLAHRGMDIWMGNHPSRRRAFSAVLTRVADTSQVPDGAACGSPHPNCGPSHGAGCSPPSSDCGSPVVVLLVRTAGTLRQAQDRLVSRCQCSRLTSPESISTLSFSTIAPAWPRGIPSRPGCSRPASHRSRYAASQLLPLFVHSLRLRLPEFLCGKPLGQYAQHLRLVPLDAHQIVPSTVHYGLAEVSLRIQGVHGQ